MKEQICKIFTEVNREQDINKFLLAGWFIVLMTNNYNGTSTCTTIVFEREKK